ncbi:Hypothetical protein NTJ_02365 [Nesidiocoris tenuis]|uniref:Uncharacterized protein n=1 Tax=Nesidiocoris tenuis TaxID=355587 RepID=A0ABN7AC15_9HEMI|nr:Hypothetical protein NTJ_02365 [Nesidiocoris tenuis]
MAVSILRRTLGERESHRMSSSVAPASSNPRSSPSLVLLLFGPDRDLPVPCTAAVHPINCGSFLRLAELRQDPVLHAMIGSIRINRNAPT